MRVIAGSVKGVRLGPVPRGVRPVADRAREGLFSSLAADVPGARVLDLYAGTGALGIEALSRGAERAVFVEQSKAALRSLHDNLERTGLRDRARVVALDALAFVTAPPDAVWRFDLALADPPYDTAPDLVDALLRGLADSLMNAGGVIVLTRRRKSSTPVIPVDWLVSKRLEYGDTTALIFRPKPREDSMGLTALCPGTFDPVTNGHLDVIERAARRFDALVVAVLDNPSKRPLFSVEERVGMLKEATSDLPSVEVDAFSGLLVDYAARRGVDLVVKGLRAVTDFEAEIQMAQMNHSLTGIETVFMTTAPQWSFLSSSLVKEVARFGGDVSALVPATVADRLRERLEGGA